ncbi:MAG: mechanosensitive ion channel family protein [Deltaproteobacteria bacterium]|nr:mechanosensitive ion channel family protein [Deltaproteobacteria bacterium]MBW2049954.1 mechanosensitive ion channel family protein [Deltaproteobacteria bacterium]MBW2112293.1 mechanosensitive ion channel family protein [Deltaproteobacteria bacterium]MBW2352718.1 mechanosensitive ion channel family protein [Deltaproteobacteria bacterium]HDZ90163.1 mechanosensitive ion channel family protein [Deltaproteobacteria bacterium]
MDIPFKEYYQKIISQPEEFLNPMVHILGIVVAGAVTWWVFNMVMGRVRKRYGKRPFFEKNLLLFSLIRRAGHYCILIATASALLNMFNLPIANSIFEAGMIMLLASIAYSMVKNILPYLEENFSKKTDTKMDDVIINLSKKFSGIIIYVAAGIMALDRLGLNVMPFVAGAGVAGIAIGFAAKDTLSNMISGILLIVDRPLKVGDRIEVWSAPKNSASWGDVIDIGLRATKIRTTDNIVIIIPNSEIMNRDIVNYTAVSDEIRVRIPIGVSYESDIGKAKDVIVEISLQLDWVIRDPAPKVVVKNFGESSVDLEARIWIRDPRRRMDTISYITDNVKEAFEREGIEIPYPKREIFIKKEAS